MRAPTVTLNPTIITWTPTPPPSPTPTLSPGQQVLVFAAEDGVLLAAQAQLVILYQSGSEPPQVIRELPLDAGTQVHLLSDAEQPHPATPDVILREVEVTDGPNRGRTGWLPQTLLEESTPATPHIIVKDSVGQGANVRRGDSTAYDLVTTMRPGESAKILGISSTGTGWYRIQLLNGVTGWISPIVVTVSGDTSHLQRAAPPPSPTPSVTPAIEPTVELTLAPTAIPTSAGP